MLNVFMLCRDDPAAAAQSLAALVPGAVLGHVGRVSMQIPLADDALRRLADEAGCDLAVGNDPADLVATARAAKPGWWLVMCAGQIPRDGWSDEAMRHIAFQRSTAIVLPEKGFARMAIARLACLFGRLSTRHHMLIVPQGQILTNRGEAVGCAARGAILKAGFDS